MRNLIAFLLYACGAYRFGGVLNTKGGTDSSDDGFERREALVVDLDVVALRFEVTNAILLSWPRLLAGGLEFNKERAAAGDEKDPVGPPVDAPLY